MQSFCYHHFFAISISYLGQPLTWGRFRDLLVEAALEEGLVPALLQRLDWRSGQGGSAALTVPSGGGGGGSGANIPSPPPPPGG